MPVMKSEYHIDLSTYHDTWAHVWHLRIKHSICQKIECHVLMHNDKLTSDSKTTCKKKKKENSKW